MATTRVLSCLLIVALGLFCPPGSTVLGGDDVWEEGYDEGGKHDRSPLPAILVGAVALGAIAKLLSEHQAAPDAPDSVPEGWLSGGPELAPLFNTSAFALKATVRGGWPLVVDYAHGGLGRVEVKLSVREAGEIITFPLPPLDGGRHIVKFDLPAWLGDDLSEAIVAVTARRGATGTETLPDFRLYGLGAGPDAVGSVAIGPLEFKPPRIRLSQGESASYQFYSKSDFDRVAVEFYQVTEASDGSRHRYVTTQTLEEGVRPGKWVGRRGSRRWDGHDRQDQPSLGTHQVQVRAWDGNGPWLCTWSDGLVTVYQ